jgi:hypothetical protein
MESALSELLTLHFIYMKQSFSALVPMAICVITHTLGIGFARSLFRRYELAGRHLHVFGRSLVLIGVVAIILGTHWLEILAWAWFYLLMDILPKAKDAVLFSVNAYTTLGSSGIDLPRDWQGMSGFEAMTAMLMFGWSTAVLAVFVQRLHSVDE